MAEAERIKKIMGKFAYFGAGIGLILFFLGAASMDSESQVIPCSLALVGLVLMWVFTKGYDYEDEDDI